MIGQAVDRPSTLRCVECESAIEHDERCAAVAVLEGVNQYGEFDNFDATAESGVVCTDCVDTIGVGGGE